MIGAESDVHVSDTPRRRFVSFSLGFALGLVINLAVIAGLVYLKLRDTSDEPWETLAIAAAGAAFCISPVQLTASIVLTTVHRIRWLSMGLVAAAVLGAVTLIILADWSSRQHDTYMEVNGFQ